MVLAAQDLDVRLEVVKSGYLRLLNSRSSHCTMYDIMKMRASIVNRFSHNFPPKELEEALDVIERNFFGSILSRSDANPDTESEEPPLYHIDPETLLMTIHEGDVRFSFGFSKIVDEIISVGVSTGLTIELKNGYRFTFFPHERFQYNFSSEGNFCRFYYDFNPKDKERFLDFLREVKTSLDTFMSGNRTSTHKISVVE